MEGGFGAARFRVSQRVLTEAARHSVEYPAALSLWASTGRVRASGGAVKADAIVSIVLLVGTSNVKSWLNNPTLAAPRFLLFAGRAPEGLTNAEAAKGVIALFAAAPQTPI